MTARETADDESPALGQGPWSDLVVALLSVNNYPLRKTFILFNALAGNGLFDLRNIVKWDVGEIVRRLGASGYDRGPALTNMLAERLKSLTVLAKDVEFSSDVLARGTRGAVSELLEDVNGVGPTVLDNFLMLRG